MLYFVTGGNGFVGQALIPELLKHGHQVLALARSEKAANLLASLGAEVHRGDLEDLESLKEGAKSTDGIVHLAFMSDLSDFSKFSSFCAIDRAAITAMAEGIEGTGKPLVIASGTLAMPKGNLATEDMELDRDSPFAERMKSEDLVMALSKEKQIAGSVVRLTPTVHGKNDQAFIPIFINIARQSGTAAYVGDGLSRWPAVHKADASAVFRLALEKSAPGAKYHAVAEQGVSMKAIMTLIGNRLQLPVKSLTQEEAVRHFGALSFVLGADNPVSSEKTQDELGWVPKQPGLLADMEANYFG